MNKSKILEISKENFKLEEFINEIIENLQEVIEPEYVFVKMRSSMIEENNMLSIHKATYGPANPFQDVVRLVDNGGSFDELMQNFVKRFA